MQGADPKSKARLDSIARQAAVSPKEHHLIELERKGYGRMRRKFKGDGSYTYKFSFKPNDGHGKLTKAAEAVRELFTPAWREGRKRAQAVPPDMPEPGGAVGIYAHAMTEKEADRFCQRCENRLSWCTCEGS